MLFDSENLIGWFLYSKTSFESTFYGSLWLITSGPPYTDAVCVGLLLNWDCWIVASGITVLELAKVIAPFLMLNVLAC